MLIHLHKQATTTPRVRAAIQASDEPGPVLAERFGVTPQTIYKWRKRDSVHDRSHTPHRLQTTLTPAQEAVAGALRKTLLVSLDDLLAVVREFLNPDVSRSGLDRCLRRHGVGNLRDLQAKAARPKHEEGIGAVLEIRRDRINPENEGRLVYISGNTATREALKDNRFGITVPGLRLIRVVEMYQWIEQKEKADGGSEAAQYSYGLGWSGRQQDSSAFREPDGHENPEMRIESRQFVAGTAQIGAFHLTSDIVARIGKPKPLEILPEHMESVHRAAGPARVKLADGKLFIGDDPFQPKLGDYRISYQLVPLQRASIIGQQFGDTLVPFLTRTGSALLFVEAGQVPASKMFAQAAVQNATWIWAFRLAGIALLIAGHVLMLPTILAQAWTMRPLGWIMGMGTRLAAAAAGIGMAAVAIAAAWLFYRPDLAAIVLLLAVAAINALRNLSMRKPATGGL